MDSSDPPAVSTDKVNRREFLNYIWAASAALLLAEAGAGMAAYLIWQPSRKTVIHVDLSALKNATYNSPVHVDLSVLKDPTNSIPVKINSYVWLSNTPSGFFALRDFCTHLGCNLLWVSADQYFACPCHQSEFFMDGTVLFGAAQRNMDSYKVTVRTPDGTRTTPPQGGPVDITGGTAFDVDLEVLITGWPRGYLASGKPPAQNE